MFRVKIKNEIFQIPIRERSSDPPKQRIPNKTKQLPETDWQKTCQAA